MKQPAAPSGRRNQQPESETGKPVAPKPKPKAARKAKAKSGGTKNPKPEKDQ